MSMEPGKPIRGCHIFQGIDDGSLNQGGNSGDRQGTDVLHILMKIKGIWWWFIVVRVSKIDKLRLLVFV